MPHQTYFSFIDYQLPSPLYSTHTIKTFMAGSSHFLHFHLGEKDTRPNLYRVLVLTPVGSTNPCPRWQSGNGAIHGYRGVTNGIWTKNEVNHASWHMGRR